jgi:hypothetical protein
VNCLKGVGPAVLPTKALLLRCSETGQSAIGPIPDILLRAVFPHKSMDVYVPKADVSSMAVERRLRWTLPTARNRRTNELSGPTFMS